MPAGNASNMTNDVAGEAGLRKRPWWSLEVVLGAVVVYLAVVGLLETKLWRPGTVFDGKTNCQIAEAQAWWDGRFDLPERVWDTALVNERVYSHFPLMFSFLAAGVAPFFQGVPHWVLLLAVGPIPLLAYGLFYRLTRSATWGAVLALGLVCGTSLWPVLNVALRGASPYYVNHALGTLGLLIFLIEFCGRRRVGVAGLGLIVATLSRQLTVAFAIPLIWLAVQGRDARQRRRQLFALGVTGVIVAGVPLAANTLKFGHPLRTGYGLIYEGRDDPVARDAQTHGLFAAHFVPRNLYYMNLGFPRLHRIEMAGEPEYHLQPNVKGVGIWWTTPVLLWLFFNVRRILRERAVWGLLAAAGIVFTILMFFHTTGQVQRGYNRFSLDFLPVLLVVIAPTCFAGKRRWISVAMVIWSVIYFRWLV